jgi:hypothetical protein
MDELNSPKLTAPLTPPSIKIGDREYTLKWTLLSRYIFGKLRRKGEILSDLTTTLDLFTAAVAHNFEALGQPIPGPENWAALIPQEKWQEVCDVTAQVAAELAKTQLAAVRAQAQPAQTGAPN